MQRGRLLTFFVLAALIAAGCSSLPGLQVLTGQTAADGGAGASLAVEALTLVMADKTGGANAALITAADRIEAAYPYVDIIELRLDAEARVFNVSMLFNPPQFDTNTNEGRVAELDSVRRAFEMTWQGVLNASEGSDEIHITLLGPGQVTTLDKGRGFIGVVMNEAVITRTDAASYLAGARNLNNFSNLILDGQLELINPDQVILYEGTPNHPMFMLSAAQEGG